MAARWVWYFRATFSILTVSVFSHLWRGPFVGRFHDWRKLLIRARIEVLGGAAALSIRSVILAQVGREGEKFR
jgi:hypothetical protein